jgi:hypothetical protein
MHHHVTDNMILANYCLLVIVWHDQAYGVG